MSKTYKITIKVSKTLDVENVNEIKKVLKDADVFLRESFGWKLSYEFKKTSKDNHIVVLKKFTAEEILTLIRAEVQTLGINHMGSNYTVKLNKQRYVVFAKSPKCCVCQLEGTEVRIEKQSSDKTPHLNLYGFDNQKNPVLMTQDHILPKSQGGSDSYENLQTMCVVCNNLKANSKLDPEQIREFRKANEAYKNKGNMTSKDRKTYLNMLLFFMDDN